MASKFYVEVRLVEQVLDSVYRTAVGREIELKKLVVSCDSYSEAENVYDDIERNNH